MKQNLIKNICYTDRVYSRINKKLNTQKNNKEVEKLILQLLTSCKQEDIEIKGKNFYIYNYLENVRITINRSTFRVITVDKI